MNYLSIDSLKKLDKYFRLFGQISSYKIASYLSFVVNSKGDQLHYDKKLNRKYIYSVSISITFRILLMDKKDQVNLDYKNIYLQ